MSFKSNSKNRLQFKPEYALATLILFLIEVVIALYATGFIRHTVGDFLVVILMYCFFRSFINMKPISLAVATLLIAYFVESLQFINFLPSLGFKHTRWTQILMGSVFDIHDMIAYTLGVCFILLIDTRCTNKSKR